MSLFGGLDDGVVESIPTLIDEDLEDLFAGGEDLFELLDERVQTPLVIPPAPVLANTPVVVDNAVPESGEPLGYTAPVFFPFGKPEPTAPQLKLSGVSSFKKINSRLLQGGALNDQEEADAIRELERALGVLGHQRRFLKEHKAGLEKWTAAVYGVGLSTEAYDAKEPASTAFGERERRDQPYHSGTGKAVMREVRVSLKCKGAKRRMDKQSLIAHVDQTWSPRHDHPKSSKKRTVKTEAEKPAKRGKPPTSKGTQAVVIGTTSIAGSAEEISQDERSTEQSNEVPDVPGASGKGWIWSDRGDSFPCVFKGRLSGDNKTLQAEGHVGRNSFPSRVEETAAKTATEPGSRIDSFDDDADVLRQRLVQALASPAVVKSDFKRGMQSKSYDEATGKTPLRADAVHVLDVTRLTHAQRVLVQLNGAGLIASSSSRGPLFRFPARRDLPS